MQHPDEGMIHSWLDGALSVEDAARVESHVPECSQCAAAVAEARGFIAASSRILTALDDVPRGVVPIAPARKRDLRVFWRAAAAVLVVGGGSLIVLREGGQDARVGLMIDTASLEPKAPVATVGAGASEAAPVTARAGLPTDARVVAPEPEAVPLSKRRTTPPTARADKVTQLPERDLSGTEALGKEGGATGNTAGQSVAADQVAPTSTAMNLYALSGQSDGTPLKLLRVERTIGGRRTVYEVAPNETVTLTEAEPLRLEEVVVTGVGTVERRQSTAGGARSVAPMRAQGAAVPPPPAAPLADSQRASDSSASRTKGAAMAKTATPGISFRQAVVGPVTTITWIEAATGKTLTLSGKLPVERLQEIRRRIEKEKTDSSRKAP